MRPAVRALGAVLRPLTAAGGRLRPSPGLSVIGWHRVDDSGDDLSTPLGDFRQHLEELGRWGAVVLPLDEAVARLYAGTLKP